MPDIDIKRGDDVPLTFNFTSDNLSITFTTTGVTVLPASGTLYKLGDTIFTVTSSASGIVRALSSDTTAPATTGTLTKVNSGDTGDATITYTAMSSSNKVDITGTTMYFYVKTIDSDLDADAKISLSWSTHINAVDGITYTKIPKAQTNITPGNYYYELQMKNASGDIMSSDTANFRVTQDIVQTIT